MSEGNGQGKRDDGAARETRVHPCIKTTWCTLARDHEGDCVEVPRQPRPAQEYGPKRKR